MIRALTAAAMLVCLLLSAAARAADAETVALQALVDEAGELFDAGRYDEAQARYAAAHAAGGPPELTYLVGRCHQEMERWDEASDAFRAYLAGSDLDPEAKGRATMALRAVEERRATGTLVIQVEPFGALVTVDGSELGQAPVEPLSVAPGRHVVRVAAPGYGAATRDVVVEGGRRTPVVVALEAVPALDGERVATSGHAPWTWVTLGTGAALLVAATTSYLLGEEDHRTVADAEPTTMSQRRAGDLAESGDRKKLAGYVLWGVGGACVATSTVLFVLDAATPGETASVRVGVAPAPGGGLLSLGGAF